jgi:hypothetical protein
MDNLSPKYQNLREELRDKTNSFLPKFEAPEYRSQPRGPMYKHLLSNCFVEKNDHAFQAHYYKKPEEESEYLFFRGRSNEKTGSWLL